GIANRGLVAVSAALAGLLAVASGAAAKATGNAYVVTNLVSDQPGQAPHIDPNLVNAWGLVAGPATPWWVADNGTDVSTLYNGDGTPRSLVVQVEGAPTGIVFNGGPNFIVRDGPFAGPSVFMWAT